MNHYKLFVTFLKRLCIYNNYCLKQKSILASAIYMIIFKFSVWINSGNIGLSRFSQFECIFTMQIDILDRMCIFQHASFPVLFFQKSTIHWLIKSNNQNQSPDIWFQIYSWSNVKQIWCVSVMGNQMENLLITSFIKKPPIAYVWIVSKNYFNLQ